MLNLITFTLGETYLLLMHNQEFNSDQYSDIVDYAIFILDKSGKVISWNANAQKLKGYRTEEIVGKNHEVFYTEKDIHHKLPQTLLALAEKEGMVIDEQWIVRKDGSKFWASIHINSLKDKDHELTSFVTIVHNLSKRKNHDLELENKIEELKVISQEKSNKLQETAIAFQKTLDSMMEGVQMHDCDWKYTYVNETLTKYSNTPKEELIGYTIIEKYPGIEHTELFHVLDDCMRNRIAKNYRTPFTFPNGRVSYFELNIQPIPDGLFILSIDITERIKAEEKILKLNRLYEFTSSINKSIVHIDSQQKLLDRVCKIAINIGKFKYVWISLLDNDNTLRIKSIGGDKEGAKKILNLEGFDHKNPIFKDIPTAKAINTGKYTCNNDLQSDPSMLPWKEELERQNLHSTIAIPIISGKKVIGILGFFSTIKNFFDKEEIVLLKEAAGDISFALENYDKSKIHQETETLVINNEKKFRALIEKSTDMKTLTSREGLFIYASPNVLKVFGYTEEEYMNKSAASFFHPEDCIDLMQKRTAILDTYGGSFPFQYRARHKNGDWIWCEGTITNMLDEPGVNAMVSNFKDITDQIKAEKEKEEMMADIIQRNKNFEQFAYIVSHNLRAPVANILGISEVLKSDLPTKERDKMQKFLFEAVNNLDEIVKDLNKILQTKTQITESKEEIYFEELVDNIKASIQNIITKEGALIESDFTEVKSTVSVKSYMQSIFYNLISNSIKYKKDHVPPHIKIKSEKIDGKLILTFRDNGKGIDLKSYQKEVFGLYKRFHTNTNVEGKGLGLFMVKTQLEVLGGKISIQSEPNQYTEFSIELPL